MDKEYYISSTKYSLQERQTKKGRVYDVVFRVIDKASLKEKQKNCQALNQKPMQGMVIPNLLQKNAKC